MSRISSPQPGLPLTPAVFHILLALSEGERHGYGIMREVTSLSGGTLRMGPGTLYGTMKRLLASGIVEEVEERADPALGDERRRYYHLTDFGEAVLRAEARRMESLVEKARRKSLLSPLGGG